MLMSSARTSPATIRGSRRRRGRRGQAVEALCARRFRGSEFQGADDPRGRGDPARRTRRGGPFHPVEVRARRGQVAAGVRTLRFPDDLPDRQPVHDGGSQRLLPRRPEGPCVHLGAEIPPAPVGADRDVRGSGEPGETDGAGALLHGARSVGNAER